MKLHLLIGIVVSGALLAGLSAVGMGLAETPHHREQVAVFGYQGLVVFWLGVVACAAYLYRNRNR